MVLMVAAVKSKSELDVSGGSSVDVFRFYLVAVDVADCR